MKTKSSIIAILIIAQWMLTLAGPQSKKDTSAQQEFRSKPTLAILPFKNTNAFARETGYGESVAAMLTTEMRNNSNFSVIERSKIAAIVNEVKISQDGLTEDMSNRLGKLFRVEVILLGDVSCIENTVQVDARLIEVGTGQVKAAEYGIANNASGIRQMIAEIAANIEMVYLRPFMGSLEVLPTNAKTEVYLDGKFTGYASAGEPLMLENLLEGNYSLKLIAGGFKEYEETVIVEAKMARQVKASLKGLPGSMTITSEPSGANVYIDNKHMGITPLVLEEVDEGEHQISLAIENYKTWYKSVTVRSFQPTNVKATLEVKPGVLIVTSNVKGAGVSVKGAYVGRCPLGQGQCKRRDKASRPAHPDERQTRHQQQSARQQYLFNQSGQRPQDAFGQNTAVGT
jgi:TolB-like protein